MSNPLIITKVHRLKEEDSKKLLNQPESGMGYQIIDTGKNNNGTNNNRQVLIATSEHVFECEEQTETMHMVPLILHPGERMTEEDEYSLQNFKIITHLSSIPPPITCLQPPSKTSLNTTPPYCYFTKPGDEFFRLSAYQNDKRIFLDGSVAPQTYATTPTDLPMTPSGLAAVARYALPNAMASCFVFKIIPPVGTLVYFGTVSPNYGMCGGGVEVYLPDGLPIGSARLFGTLPEK